MILFACKIFEHKQFTIFNFQISLKYHKWYLTMWNRFQVISIQASDVKKMSSLNEIRILFFFDLKQLL